MVVPDHASPVISRHVALYQFPDNIPLRMELIRPTYSLLILLWIGGCSAPSISNEPSIDAPSDTTYVFQSSGSLPTLVSVVNDRRNGVFIEYFPDGNIREIANYTNDTLNGWRYIFYGPGLMLSSEYFNAGVREGESHRYATDGQLREVLVFSNDTVMKRISTEQPHLYIPNVPSGSPKGP